MVSLPYIKVFSFTHIILGLKFLTKTTSFTCKVFETFSKYIKGHVEIVCQYFIYGRLKIKITSFICKVFETFSKYIKGHVEIACQYFIYEIEKE